MRLDISGRQLRIRASLREHVETALGTIAAKFAERPTDAHVTFHRDGRQFACEISIHLSTGLTAQAKSAASDIVASFDICCDRISKQLRRYKRRLKNHHHSRTGPVESFPAPTFTLASSDHEDEESEPETLQPVIIAETETRVQTLSVGEAVMQMELAEAPFLVFMNEGHQGLDVVYTRSDGNIGWISSEGR